MTRTNNDNATIRQALIFYQQHLTLECDNREARHPKNGKLPSTSEDVAAQEEYKQQIETITKLLGSLNGASKSHLAQDTSPSPSPADLEPYLNPISGQWIFPETKFSAGPSKSTSISAQCDSMHTVDSSVGIESAPSLTTSYANPSQSLSEPVATPCVSPSTTTQSSASKAPSIRRKPLPTSPPRQMPLSSPSHQRIPNSQISPLPYEISAATSTAPAAHQPPTPERWRASWDVRLPMPFASGESHNINAIPQHSQVQPQPQPLLPFPDHGRNSGQAEIQQHFYKSTPPIQETIVPPSANPSFRERVIFSTAGLGAFDKRPEKTPFPSPLPPRTLNLAGVDGYWSANSSVPSFKLDARQDPLERASSRTPEPPRGQSSYPIGNLGGAYGGPEPDGLRRMLSRAELSEKALSLPRFPGTAISGSSQSAKPVPTQDKLMPSRPDPNSSLDFPSPNCVTAQFAPDQRLNRLRMNDTGHFEPPAVSLSPHGVGGSPGAPYTNHLSPFLPVAASRTAERIQNGMPSSSPPLYSSRGQSGSAASALRPSGFAPLNRPSLTLDPAITQLHTSAISGSAKVGEPLIPNTLRVEDPTPTYGFGKLSIPSHDASRFQTDSSRSQSQQGNFHLDSRPESVISDLQVVVDSFNGEAADEKAMLQRFQDDFNREGEIALANQEAFARRVQDEWNSSLSLDSSRLTSHQGRFSGQSQPVPLTTQRGMASAASYTPDLSEWQSSDSNLENGVALFAPAREDSDKIPPGVVVKPLMVTKAQSSAQQMRRRYSMPKTRAKSTGDEDLTKLAADEIARYEVAQLERENSAQQIALDKIRAARTSKASNKSQCTACGDEESTSAMATLPCGHAYCSICIGDAFKHAFSAGKVFICCKKKPCPVDVAARFLPSDFVTQYRVKLEERTTANPVYCARPGCSTFITPSNLKGPLAKCGKCGFVSCSLCKNPEHKGICPPDSMGLKLMNLAGSKSWRQCSRCKAIVERDEGCLHMTCMCGYEFCYSCGGPWEGCGASCPRTS